MTKLIGSADLPGLVTATSDALGIPPADIEKDIWVVEVLRSVFRAVDGARIIFKGGTSLSKAYGIIERFVSAEASLL
jgi:predicted nucleotidyltransferase component of viral defense system